MRTDRPIERPIERIVIIGGGVAGWLAASMIVRKFATGTIAVSVIDGAGPDDSLGIPCPVERVLPVTLEILARAGYSEDNLVRLARGTFMLGSAISDGAAPAFLPFGDIGAPLGAVAFHQLAARIRADNATINLANYTLAALCAQAGRFARPTIDDRSVHTTLNYGMHLDSAAFARALTSDATKRDVTAIAGQPQSIERDGDGLITAITTDRHDRVIGDLFIDASGPNNVLSEAFEDWSRWLPCDRAAHSFRESGEPPPPYAHINLHGSGWQSFAPVNGAIGEQFVYASAAMDDNPGGTPFRSGRRITPWDGNCLAIGGAATVIDPIAGTQLHLTVSALSRFLTLLPTARHCRAESAEYNRQTISELERARDFAMLFYKGNALASQPFWDECRAMMIPDILGHKIALYESCGRVALHDEEIFEEAGWIGAFEALGMRPRRYDALANGIAQNTIEAHFAKVRDAMLKAVATMPPHAEYLRILRG